jgi:hypothetical protein
LAEIACGDFSGVERGASLGAAGKKRGFCRQGSVGGDFSGIERGASLGGRQKAWFLPAR